MERVGERLQSGEMAVAPRPHSFALCHSWRAPQEEHRFARLRKGQADGAAWDPFLLSHKLREVGVSVAGWTVWWKI